MGAKRRHHHPDGDCNRNANANSAFRYAFAADHYTHTRSVIGANTHTNYYRNSRVYKYEYPDS